MDHEAAVTGSDLAWLAQRHPVDVEPAPPVQHEAGKPTTDSGLRDLDTGVGELDPDPAGRTLPIPTQMIDAGDELRWRLRRAVPRAATGQQDPLRPQHDSGCPTWTRSRD